MLQRALTWLALMLALVGVAVHAGQERYDYDALGRLVRVIDEQGRVTEYVYDPAGNLLQVIFGSGGAQPPSIASIAPTRMRRGETRAIQINGTGLNGAQVSIAGPGLTVSNLSASATLINFTLAATAIAPLGANQIMVSNAAGSTTTSIAIDPVLPVLGMSPLPIALPPSGGARNFFVSISGADGISHAVAVASANPSIATVSPASVTFAPGETEKVVSVTGVSPGTTAINLTSSTLASTSVPVFVTAEFVGLTTSYAKSIGVVLEAPAGGTSTTFGPFASPLVGVAFGSYIGGVAPGTLATGSGPTPLVISGAGLAGVTAVSISPSDGLTLGAISVAPDGLSVSVPVTVAANAPTTVRRVTLSGAQQPYLPARPDANQILITLPLPEIFSIDPIFAVTGTTGAALTVRGRNLQAAQSVNFAPGTGISVSTTPTVTPDGTVLTASFSVNPLAPAGNHVVTVTTPAGASTATASPANSFRVANEVQAVYTPISAPLLGVVLQDGSTPPAPSLNAFSSLVGVAVGPVVAARSPAAGIVGQTVQLTLSGNELQGVTAVQFSPSDGLSVGAPAPSGDGRTAAMQVTIAPSAPQTLRALRVLAGAATVPFSDPTAAQFLVTAPLPQLDSVAPIVYQVGGGNVTMTIRGRNFQGAQLVRLIPPDGVSIAAPVVDGTGTQLTATVNVSAGAAQGSRVVVVATLAGESPATGDATNTVQLVPTIAGSVTPVVAPDLGVVLESATPPPAVPVGPIVSPDVGVVLQDSTPPPAATETVRATIVGVAVGPYSNGVQVPPLTPTSTGTLVISGSALGDVTSLAIEPSTGITLGSLTIAPDGSQVSVPLTLSGASAGLRAVRVFRGTTQVPFIPPGTDTFRIGVGLPTIDSITPILANRGEVVTMTIRGSNYQDVMAVTATPGTGLSIDNAPSPNAGGTEITVRIGIAADAPPGSHVIRVFTPGGSTTEAAIPANTFNVLQP